MNNKLVIGVFQMVHLGLCVKYYECIEQKKKKKQRNAKVLLWRWGGGGGVCCGEEGSPCRYENYSGDMGSENGAENLEAHGEQRGPRRGKPVSAFTRVQ